MDALAATAQVSQRAITRLTWGEIQTESRALITRHGARLGTLTGVYGVPTGGALVACLIARAIPLPLLDAPQPRALIVDDLVDSGHTLRPYVEQGFLVDALYRKPHSPPDVAPTATELTGWLHFPWEPTIGAPTDAVTRLLQYLGEDPRREGLRQTPARMLNALREMTSGYQDDPAALLATVFAEHYDEMVLLRGIEFTSVCEHHLLPFTGVAHVGYLPHARVVGLSKLARLVQCFARRLQVQERLTTQITTALMTHLSPLGAGAILTARHQCMSCRGVKLAGAHMVTSSLVGRLREDATARSEFLTLCGLGR